MRRIPLLVCLCACGAVAAGVSAGQQTTSRPRPAPARRPVTQERIDRLERWLKLVARHQPGEIDPELEEVAAWSNASLQDLWVDAEILMQLARIRHGAYFRSSSADVHYSKAQAHRMSVLSCVAAGDIFDEKCMLIIKADDAIDRELRQLSALANAATLRGDPNYIVRRGALLHGDVGMLGTHSMDAPLDARPSGGPQSWRMEISDGQELALRSTAVHWEIARMLLDFVIPKGLDRVAPQRDDMVLAWYRATSAWMQLHEDHNEMHLTRGLRIFPDDPDLLFLAACQKETFAGAAIQTAVGSAVLPVGIKVGVNSSQTELREAERFFRRTLEVKPSYVEARMRYGRVLGGLAKHAAAVVELRRAAAELTEPELSYHAYQFLGAEEEALGNREAAQAAYERAAALFPHAQSPLLALSQLARRYGDRNGALRAADRLFALQDDPANEREDPWWTYYLVQARSADDLLVALLQPYLTDRLQ
jgi:tetratricopeptide (TPR) repeat protein